MGTGFLEARDALSGALEKERISWVHPDNYHVTLRFLGDTGIGDINRIRKALRDQVRLPADMEVQLLQLGSFGSGRRPRVVWIGLEDWELFEALKAAVDDALGQCGFPPGDQPFRPHLTLGRIRSLRDTDLFYRVVEEMKDAFRGIVQPGRLVFYRSILGNRGPRYIPLEEILPLC